MQSINLICNSSKKTFKKKKNLVKITLKNMKQLFD